ncbi:ecdysteroid-phosphate phosphatase-like isoform X2 [Tachypleus tridentatus]|uniref:ecdysteroid-phosphate phosphatase-like isoform X2 n=1 Tax=Tachypleus tridentatus TaxID=6853 RepID=UPI003FD6C03E
MIFKMASLPVRKNVTLSKSTRQPQSALQILLQMGFPKHRAEKALAATGDRGVQLATDWLLAHYNDTTLDDSTPREYILYLCPTGDLLDHLHQFFTKSKAQCGRNGAHNYLPHITLCSFFQAPDDSVPHLVHALKHVIQKLQSELPEQIRLEHYTSTTFLGLFVSEEHNDILKRLAVHFMREVSEYSIQVEPYLKALHITLAYQFQQDHYKELEELTRTIDTSASVVWELRLYSRDTRIKGNEVHRVLYSHSPIEPDELELHAGDFVYVNGDQLNNTLDGWVEGTSWLTGCSGVLPKNHIERAAESDAWTLHRSVPVLRNIQLDELDDSYITRRLPIPFLNESPSPRITSQIKGDSQSDSFASPHNQRESLYENVEMHSPKASKSKKEMSRVPIKKEGPRQLFIIRHAERVDFTFGAWIPACFDSSGNYIQKDLNMPISVPARSGGSHEFLKDCPLTHIGLYQATLTGEALRDVGVNFVFAYSSPSLRCVQTCTNILRALGQDDIPIRIEPGLFEWLAWYQDSMPAWMTPQELFEYGFNIDLHYNPLITTAELWEKKESSEQYYIRSFYITQTLLKRGSRNNGNILFTGHAATLDTCSRQLVGHSPRNANDLVHLVHKIPYCAVVTVEESGEGKWTLVSPPLLPLTHTGNIRFDWKHLL